MMKFTVLALSVAPVEGVKNPFACATWGCILCPSSCPEDDKNGASTDQSVWEKINAWGKENIVEGGKNAVDKIDAWGKENIVEGVNDLGKKITDSAPWNQAKDALGNAGGLFGGKHEAGDNDAPNSTKTTTPETTSSEKTDEVSSATTATPSTVTVANDATTSKPATDATTQTDKTTTDVSPAPSALI